MEINGVDIKDTYAEGFGIKVTRMLITAATKNLAKIAATEATGYGTSVIGWPAEAGIDGYVPPAETPDGRPGYTIMICQGGKKALDHELMERIGIQAQLNRLLSYIITINGFPRIPIPNSQLIKNEWSS